MRRKKYFVTRRVVILCMIVMPFALIAVAGVASAAQGAKDTRFFTVVSANEQDIYQDEGLLVRYDLYGSSVFQIRELLNDGAVDDCWMSDFSLPSKFETETVKRNGKKYARVTIYKKMLFPFDAGAFHFHPDQVSINAWEKGLSSKDRQITQPKQLLLQPTGENGEDTLVFNVKPFPEDGRPDTFTGSSGQYHIKADYSTKLNVNGFYTMTVKITGQGNIWAVDLPEIDFGRDWTMFDMSTSVINRNLWDREIASGEKTFFFYLWPMRGGDLIVPSIKFSYFDPVYEEYRTIRTAKHGVRIIPDQTKALPESASAEKGIVLLFDMSTSMQALDFEPKTRFDIARDFLTTVIEDIEGYKINLIEFNRYSRIVKIDLSDPGKFKEHYKNGKPTDMPDAPAIGDALLKAGYLLNKTIQPNGVKLVLLVADGKSNAGHLTSFAAARKLKRDGVTIHSVAIGDKTAGKVLVSYDGKVEKSERDISVPVDYLKKTAEITGGQGFHIDTSSDKKAITSALLNLIK